jgi:hypothetical protein
MIAFALSIAPKHPQPIAHQKIAPLNWQIYDY